MTYPDDGYLGIQYDALNRISQFSSLATFSYTLDDKVDTITYGNSGVTSYNYDSRNMPTDIVVEKGVTKNRSNNAARNFNQSKSIDLCNCFEMSQMNLALKDMFLKLWEEYFDGAELPIAFYYTDEEKVTENDPATSGQCLIENLVKVRQGTPLRFGVDSIGCPGGRRYAGFSRTLSDNFEYFLSCGIPGIMEGERYKKSPELVREVMKRFPEFKAPNKFIVFKRWDQLDESDEPEVVIFFAKPDVLAGLFTLANFDEIEEGVIAPFGSGCSSIILHPYLEGEKNPPQCVLGMFDISARPYVHSDIQTFAVPIAKFDRMVEDIQESFLITATWEKIRKRITPS